MSGEERAAEGVTAGGDTALSIATALPDDGRQSVELILVRHGNAKKQRGETYVTAPLTELGRKQAALAGQFLKNRGTHLDGFYCSSLKRAVEAATIIGEHIGQAPAVSDGIHEMEYREIPAVIAVELLARTGLFNRYFQERVGKELRYPMIGRVATGILGILARHPQGRVGIVAHGGVISSILSWYLPRERRHWWRDTVGNCSITRLALEQGRATLLEYDFVAHLGDLTATAHLPNYSFSADEGV
jgi:probable phosphoglycerate mutase